MAHRKKILHVIKSLGRGGAEMLLPETLKLHGREQFDFEYVYFLPWKNQMVSAIEDAGGKVTCIPASNNIKLLMQARKLAAYIRENNVALVHAHLPWAGIVSRIAGKLTGVPVVYTEHNKQERYHLATRMANLSTLNWLNGIICVSTDVEESVKKHKPGLRAPVRTILNGVNTSHFISNTSLAHQVRADLNIPVNAPVIGTIAVFRFQKRLDLWLQLAGKIRSQFPEARFIIVGDGPLRKKLEETASSLNLTDIVHFAGLQTDVRPWLASFNLYMMSSIFEGLPIALLEAMSSGLPVISTTAGGIGEVITHNKDGMLCDVNEPDKLVGYAEQILADKTLGDRLGREARRTVERSFSMEKMVHELEAYYSSILRK